MISRAATSAVSGSLSVSEAATRVGLTGDRRTVIHVGIEVDDAIEIAEKIDILTFEPTPPRPDVVDGASYAAGCNEADVSNWDRATKAPFACR
jgi:hypothetical protein